jgi:hypothetical protein
MLPCEACSAVWTFGTSSALALEPRKTSENLDRIGWFQDLPDANWLLAISPALNTRVLTLVPICPSNQYHIASLLQSRGRSYFITDSQSVSQSVSQYILVSGAHDQILLSPLFCWKIALLFNSGRPLWREDGSVICSSICQWSELQRTHNHTLLSYLRLLGSLSVASYDSQGLRWKYSYPPPHGDLSSLQLVLI